MNKKVRTFKQYDNIDKACEDVIYEHGRYFVYL